MLQQLNAIFDTVAVSWVVVQRLTCAYQRRADYSAQRQAVRREVKCHHNPVQSAAPGRIRPRAVHE